ncbi:hypothetical protein Hdeb2414_s0029g00705301 [Helianthus debilis subsp. tardiflorus]
MADAEVNENVGEVETEIETESLTADIFNEDQVLNVNPPHTATFEQVSAGSDMLQEDPTADLHPRKQSRRDPRINRERIEVPSSSPEANIPVVTASQLVSATGTPVKDVLLEFLSKPKAAMYMSAAKTGEGSSNTPSDAEVLKAMSLLEQAVRESVAAEKPVQEEVREPASSPNSENLFGDVDVRVLIKRITALEEDKIFKDVQIASLLEEITRKNQQIQDLETNLGSLSAIVMDLKPKLEGKFGKNFAEPPKEYTAAEKEQMDKEHEEAINK